MPGLIRGVARTAVIAGTATAVSNRVSRQAGRWADQEQAQAYDQQQAYQQQPVYAAPAPAAPTADMDSKLAQLKELGQLREQGVLTDAEFEAKERHPQLLKRRCLIIHPHRRPHLRHSLSLSPTRHRGTAWDHRAHPRDHRRARRHHPIVLWVAGILGVIGLVLGFVGRGRFERVRPPTGRWRMGNHHQLGRLVLSGVGLLILVGVFADQSEEASVDTEHRFSGGRDLIAGAAGGHVANRGRRHLHDRPRGWRLPWRIPNRGRNLQRRDRAVLGAAQPRGIRFVNLPDGDEDFPGYQVIDEQADEMSRSSRASSGCLMTNRRSRSDS